MLQVRVCVCVCGGVIVCVLVRARVRVCLRVLTRKWCRQMAFSILEKKKCKARADLTPSELATRYASTRKHTLSIAVLTLCVCRQLHYNKKQQKRVDDREACDAGIATLEQTGRVSWRLCMCMCVCARRPYLLPHGCGCSVKLCWPIAETSIT